MCQVAETYADQQKWCKMALHNIASTGEYGSRWSGYGRYQIDNWLFSGKFSTDRTIAEYAREIWGIEPGETKLAAPYEEASNE